jgi:hypothetical protein
MSGPSKRRPLGHNARATQDIKLLALHLGRSAAMRDDLAEPWIVVDSCPHRISIDQIPPVADVMSRIDRCLEVA